MLIPLFILFIYLISQLGITGGIRGSVFIVANQMGMVYALTELKNIMGKVDNKQANKLKYNKNL